MPCRCADPKTMQATTRHFIVGGRCLYLDTASIRCAANMPAFVEVAPTFCGGSPTGEQVDLVSLRAQQIELITLVCHEDLLDKDPVSVYRRADVRFDRRGDAVLRIAAVEYPVAELAEHGGGAHRTFMFTSRFSLREYPAPLAAGTVSQKP